MKGLQRFATRNLRRAVVVLLSHIQGGMTEDIANDTNMCRIKLRNSCRRYLAKSMRTEMVTKVRFREIAKRSCESITRDAVSILVNPKPTLLFVAAQQRTMYFKIFVHRRSKFFRKRVIPCTTVFHILGGIMQREALASHHQMRVDVHCKKSPLPNRPRDQKAYDQGITEMDGALLVGEQRVIPDFLQTPKAPIEYLTRSQGHTLFERDTVNSIREAFCNPVQPGKFLICIRSPNQDAKVRNQIKHSLWRKSKLTLRNVLINQI